MIKLKKNGWKYITISLLAGVASAVICLIIGVPQVVANAIPTGVAAATVFALKSKWMA